MTVRIHRGDLDRRLSALEARLASAPDTVTADAQAVVAKITAMAARYSPVDAETPRSMRETKFSMAGKLAWAIRFGSADEFTECLAEAFARVTP